MIERALWRCSGGVYCVERVANGARRGGASGARDVTGLGCMVVQGKWWTRLDIGMELGV